MQKGLLYNNMTYKDLLFFEEVVKDSSEWQQVECKMSDLRSYYEGYFHLGGDWRIWSLEGQSVAITYHFNNVPSNNKTWLGTILVTQGHRKKGIGRLILERLSLEIQSKGEKVLFVGCPIQYSNWIQFLNKCNFEQFKVEKDSQGSEYLILIRPL